MALVTAWHSAWPVRLRPAARTRQEPRRTRERDPAEPRPDDLEPAPELGIFDRAGVGPAATGYVAPGWRCVPAEAPAAMRRGLEAAVGELPVCEQPDGSNRGPRVDVYTAPDVGIPWCAAFVSWCYSNADGGSPFGRFTGSWQFYEWGAARGRLLAPADAPRPGDVAVNLRGDPRARPHGHTVLVGSVLDDGRIATVEGNAGNAVRGLVRAQRA